MNQPEYFLVYRGIDDERLLSILPSLLEAYELILNNFKEYNLLDDNLNDLALNNWGIIDIKNSYSVYKVNGNCINFSKLPPNESKITLPSKYNDFSKVIRGLRIDEVLSINN